MPNLLDKHTLREYAVKGYRYGCITNGSNGLVPNKLLYCYYKLEKDKTYSHIRIDHENLIAGNLEIYINKGITQ